MQQKILFYGNSTLASIALLFNNNIELLNKFKIINPQKDDGFLSSSFCFENDITSWTKRIEDADIIVFQHFYNESVPYQASTEFLQSQYQHKKRLICVPTLQWNGYLSERHTTGVIFPYILLWLRSLGKNFNKIWDWFNEETDDRVNDLITYKIRSSLERMQSHHNDIGKNYTETISMMDIIKEHKNKLICSIPDRPTPYYINTLFHRIVNLVDTELSQDMINDDTSYFNDYTHPSFLKFYFWRKFYTNIDPKGFNSHTKEFTKIFLLKNLERLKFISTHEFAEEFSVLI
jgi:hypothetical protein